MSEDKWKIDRNIPLPTRRRVPGGRYADLPLSQMRIGDSILIETCKKESWARRYSSIATNLRQYLTRMKIGGKFKVGLTGTSNTETREIRIWKIKQ